MNIIETKPIGELILNVKTPKRYPKVEHYVIPDFQRGYRWEKIHVVALLDDIDNFMQTDEPYYCLQPIVVAPIIDDDGFPAWEVIDGQQRLITLHIIFKQIQKVTYNISFSKRQKSTKFIAELNEQTYSDENPDFHFMSVAHSVITKWFNQKKEYDVSYIDEFYSKVSKKIQVIWYQLADLDEGGKIDIFRRLNIGKIPLTDAELIRALLLSKMKYGLTEREAHMRQAEVSNEWNLIEHELRKEEFWYFLNNELKDTMSSRIEFIFNILADGTAKNYSTYMWFEKAIKHKSEEVERENAFSLWDESKIVFSKFRSWYYKRTLYHYVGYLLTYNYPISDILKNSKTTKPKFESWLYGEVKKIVATKDLKTIIYGNKDAEKVFLLFNILTVENLKDTPLNRFPFNHYKKIKTKEGGWSIEHIHAQNSEPMKEEKAIRTWLEETFKAIENITILEVETEQIDENGNKITKPEKIELQKEYIDRIIELLSSTKIDTDVFNKLKDDLIRLFDSASVHEIDNLALLSKRDNSSLSNFIFPVKRNIIIGLEKEGKFIPPCTRNVFLKFYSNSDHQPYYWSKTDKAAYFKAMEDILTPLFN